MTETRMILSLGMEEIQAIARYAAACASPALSIFEEERRDDPRPRAGISAALAFAEGAARTKSIRDCAWAAQRAAHDARDAGQMAASYAARAAMAAAGAAFLHPIPRATQVKHILGAAAYAARAAECAGGGGGVDPLDRAVDLAQPVIVDVLRRYPRAPPGGGRIGELTRALDAALRETR